MKKGQPRKKTQSNKKGPDIESSFVVIPEITQDHWRENLDRFFDENETGMDYVRHLMDISNADIDHYYFTGGYDIYPPLPQKQGTGRPKKSEALNTRLGNITMPYESNGGFRYALPE